MANLTLLDTTRAGRPGEDLERKLHRMIVGQDEAINNIVRAYLLSTNIVSTSILRF
jgi:ATP-dependent Clp protease ATP-binding subunit ClpA